MLRNGSIEATESWTNATDNHGDRCERVHRTLKRIVKARGALDAQEAAALREAADLMLWRRYAAHRWSTNLEREMGYTPRAAMERLRVAKAIVDLPEIADALNKGELPFSAARELTRVATADTEAEWLAMASDKNLREIEECVSGHERATGPSIRSSRSSARRSCASRSSPRTYALLRQAMTILERELGERLDDDALVRTLSRRVIDGNQARDRAP